MTFDKLELVATKSSFAITILACWSLVILLVIDLF